MSTQVDDLQIKLTADANNAESAIDKLIAKISQLQSALSNANKMKMENIVNPKAFVGIDKQMQNVEKQIMSFQEKMKKLRETFGNIGKDYADKGGRFDSAEKIQAEIERLQVKLYNAQNDLMMIGDVGSKSFDNAAKKVIRFENQIESLEEKLKELGNTFGSEKTDVEPEKVVDTEEIEKASMTLLELRNSLNAMQKSPYYIDLTPMFRAIGDAASETISIVKRATSAFTQFAYVINKPIISAFTGLADKIKNFNIMNVNIVKSFTRMLKMLRLMITRMALRALIAEAKTSFGELIQFSAQVAASYNKLRNAIKYLADTLAALVAPIFKVSGSFAGLGSIVDSIADKIVDFANKVNQVISALLGHSTWIKATKQQKNYAASIDKTTGKQKKLNKQLAAFDELNNLTTNKDNGNNPTDTGTGGSQFQEQPIDPKWKNFADWLKDMWKRGDGYELGRFLGEKLQNALRKIPWGKIQNFMRRLGSFLATTLNGFFETPGLSKDIGNTIASAINSGLILAEEFLDKFHFDSFGKFIGETVSEAIKGIHWTRLQNACKKLGTGIATAINNLVNTGVLREIGKAIGNLLLAAINLAFSIMTNIKWDVLGQELNAGIKKFLSTMSETDETGLNGWQKLGTAIGESVKGALKAINTVLGDPENRKMIGKAIYDFFESFDYKGIRSALWELALNLVKLFATSLVSAMKSGNFRAALGDVGKIFNLVLAGKIIKGIASILSKAVATALGYWLGSKVLELGLGGALTLIGTKLAALGSSVLAFAATFGPVLAAIGLVIAAIAVWKNHWEDIKEAGRLFAERTVEHLQSIGYWFETNLPNFTLLVKTVFSSLKDFIIRNFGDIVPPLKYGIGQIKEFFVRTFTEIGAAIKERFEAFKATIKNGIEYVKSLFKQVGEWIKTIIETGSLNLYNILTGRFKGAGEIIKSVFEGIKNVFTIIIDYMSRRLRDFGSQVKETFNNSLIGKAVGFVGGLFRQNAGGGIYSGGRWHPIQGYAGGGVVKSAEMFMARENGAPEMVGQLGGHTAVANNDQIVASISNGVYRAVKSAMGSGGSGTQTVQVEVIPDKDNLFQVIRKQGNDYQRRTGNPVWA